MNTYDEPLITTHFLQAADLSSAAVLANIVGPYGRKGRVLGLTAAVTTAVTTAAAALRVGSTADPDAYATLEVAVGAVDTVANQPDILTDDDNLIPANSVVELDTDGAAAAGAAGVTLVMAWF